MSSLSGIVQMDHVQVEISIRIGKAKLTVAELSALQEHDILPLESEISDQVEICVGDHVVAVGELVTADDDQKLILRITSAAGIA